MHPPAASATTHRMPDEDVHPSKCALDFREYDPEVGKGAGLRRFSMPRLIHRIAIKTSGGECFAETKQHFFRAAGSMCEHRLGMRTWRRGENSKRGCVGRQHYFFDPNAGLDHVREHDPKNQSGDGCCNEPTVGANTHDFFRVMANYFR